jgi:hypothetical protein
VSRSWLRACARAAAMSASRDPKWWTSIRELVARASARSRREISQLRRATSSSAA